MDVWVVEAGMDYEGAVIMGVRSTEDGADRLVDEIKRESSCDWVGHSKHLVDEDTAKLDNIT